MRDAMNRRKIIFWLLMLGISAVLTGYLFCIDDMEEKHKPGYVSTDSIWMTIAVFTFYTLIITSVIGGLSYLFLKSFLGRSKK